MYICDLCNYKTPRLDAYKRHQTSKKHINKENEKNAFVSNEHVENAYINIANVCHSRQNVCISKGDTVQEIENAPNGLSCKKCSKSYKHKKYLIEHEKHCIGIDSLTCPTCMKTFSDRTSKSKHIAKKCCKPVSIFDYAKRHNITDFDIFVNNYGKERNDYLDFSVMLSVIKYYNMIPKYLKLKHFNPDFPENHNIKYKNNEYWIKKDDMWEIMNKHSLSNKLFYDCGNDLFYFFNMNKEQLRETLHDIEDLEDKINYMVLETTGRDKDIKRQILDVIKSVRPGSSI